MNQKFARPFWTNQIKKEKTHTVVEIIWQGKLSQEKKNTSQIEGFFSVGLIYISFDLHQCSFLSHLHTHLLSHNINANHQFQCERNWLIIL